jgi:hypothetical protein
MFMEYKTIDMVLAKYDELLEKHRLEKEKAIE